MELRRQLEKLKLNVLVLLSITIKLTSSGLDENLSVKITPSPDPRLKTVCSGQEIVLTCDTNSPANPNRPKVDCAWTFGDVQYQNIEGNTCVVDTVVKLIPVIYNCTCVDTDLHWNLGSTAINISANAQRPIIKINGPSSYIIPPHGGLNLTITSTITSHVILTESPNWRMNGEGLYPNAREEYKSIDEMTYISLLHIYNLSSDDTGNYTLSASNTCGLSSKFVYVQFGTNNDPYHGRSKKSGKQQKKLIVGLSVVFIFVVLVLILALCLCYCCWKKRRRNKGKDSKHPKSKHPKSSVLTPPVGTLENQGSIDYGATENTPREKWKEALLDHSHKLCSRLQPVISCLVNKLGTTLSERTRSKVKTDRLLSDYDKVDEVVKSIKKREEFDNFCNILEELKHKTLADDLKSAASAS